MMKEKRWKLRQDYEIEDVERLARELGVDRVIATLLVERGVRTFDEARRFFRPSLEHLHDPFEMKDMDKAVERIEKALRAKERIMVYGDYDVDGTSAVAVVYGFLHTLTDNIDFYIPDREKEGYGISFEGVDYAKETGVKLIIALDCGIKAIEQVDYASEAGIEFIIGDHHLPGEEIPKSVAVLDPKRVDCPYPYKELSGCGIGFKIVEAILEKNIGVKLSDNPEKLDTIGQRRLEDLKLRLLHYLDLVVVSIASDIVPMTGENRVLAYYGLKVINTHPRAGLEAILSYGNIARADGSTSQNRKDQGYFAKNLTISDLVFLVGPRINAAGRLHSAFDSVRLLLEEDIERARLLAKEIDDYNQERKELDSSATDTAKRRIDGDVKLRDKKSIVLFDENWHKGVVGIVASRLVELYYKPTIIFTRSTDDMYVGSARSAGEFDIHAALERCADLLEHFGGHKCAAGVSVKPENFERFCERFEEEVSKGVQPEEAVPEIEIDATISFAENITPKFLRILKQFSPFGPENNVPIFLTKNLIDTGHPRVVGAKDVKHLKFAPIPFDERSQSYSAIGFQLGEYYDRVRRGEHFDLVYQLEENYWNGKTEMQLNVKDIHFRD
ncbi:MAG: single-stranded-DNA-specific exonuclease RecJ [Bacteroidales bacterium]|nr:single-stranded-DNA-specific exonuclease RecJ [Bacteroidales bacterium]